MIKDTYLDDVITIKLQAVRDAERANHKSSGKLSASMLGWPLQWQILKTIGVEPKEVDEYTQRKFLRGKHVEEWLVDHMRPKETQKFVEYRDCIGYIDAVVDTEKWQHKCGVIPHEVKSVSNMKFKRLNGDADMNHRLQATLYALGMGVDHYAIDYVATDDYRVRTYVYDIFDTKQAVDQIIDDYNQALESKRLPEFNPRETWQAKDEYNNYPDFSKLGGILLEQKLKDEFPEAYNKLKGQNDSES